MLSLERNYDLLTTVLALTNIVYGFRKILKPTREYFEWDGSLSQFTCLDERGETFIPVGHLLEIVLVFGFQDRVDQDTVNLYTFGVQVLGSRYYEKIECVCK
jgi:hypothetical protein